MSLPQSRIWMRYRARMIKGVKMNTKSSFENLNCRFCNTNTPETQEHLQICGGTWFERRGLHMAGWRDLLLFWRRMTVKLSETVT